MRILEIILPVLVMLVLGMACRKLKLLTKSGIDNMKLLVTNIMLPVAIFHALATADYSVETWKLVGIMFVMLVVSFGVGFLLKPLMNGEYRKYLPFMVSVYEGTSWRILCIPACAGRKISHRSQYWILQDFCLDSASIWGCWDRWKTERRSMQRNYV